MAVAAKPTPEDQTRSRLLGRVFADVQPLGRRIVARMQQEMPAYAELPVEDLLPDVYTNLELMLPAMRSGRPFTEAELAAFADHGESRARQGIAIEELLRGWRLGTQALVDEMVHAARQTGVEEGMVLDLTRSVLAAADVAVVSAARGHRHAELRSDREEQHRRAVLVRGAIFGRLGAQQIRAEVGAYGLKPDRAYRAFRVSPTPERPVDELEQLLGVAPGSPAPRGLATLIDGDLCGFIDAPPPGQLEVSIGLGPPASLDALAASFRLASRAAFTAASFGLRGVYDMSRLGLLPAVLADDDVGEELVRRYIEPVSRTSSAADVLSTVRCYLAHRMRVDDTARALFVHQNTVRYRLRRFEESTGADLRNPADVLEVWWGLQRAQVGDR